MNQEFDAKVPIYLQIMQDIKRDIITGKLKGGDKLPSVREMAEKMRVNPNTIQRAYQELEREQVTFTQRGMGTFITEEPQKLQQIKAEMSGEVIRSFVEGMRSLGFCDEDIIQCVKTHIQREDK